MKIQNTQFQRWPIALLAAGLILSGARLVAQNGASSAARQAVPASGGESTPAQEVLQPILRVEIGAHTAYVRGLAFTPDGETLISAGDDKTLRFWNVPSARQTQVVRFGIGEGEQGMLRAAAIVPDADKSGSRIAVVQRADAPPDSKGKKPTDAVLIYNRQAAAAAAAAPPATAPAPPADTRPDARAVTRIETGLNLLPVLAFSRDGRYMAVSGYNRAFCQVRIFDLQYEKEGKKAIQEIASFPKRLRDDWVSEDAQESTQLLTTVDALAFSPDGTRIATGNRNGTVRIFETTSGKERKSRDFSVRRRISALDWKNDPVTGGDAIALGVEDQLYIWNPNNDLFEKQPAGNQVLTLAMDDSGRVVCGLGGNLTGINYGVMLWKRSRSEPNARPIPIGSQNSIVTGVAIDPNGQVAASGDENGRVYLWDLNNGGERLTIAAQSQTLNRVRWRSDSRALAWTVTDSGNSLRYAAGYDLAEGVYLDAEEIAQPPQEASTFLNRNNVREAVGWTVARADGTYGVGTPTPTLYLNNRPGGDRRGESGSRPRVSFGGGDGATMEIPLPEGEEALSGAVAQVEGYARRYQVILATNRRVGVWEIVPGPLAAPVYLRSLSGFEQLPRDVSVSPDNQLVAATANDGTIRVWSLLNPTPETKLVPTRTAAQMSRISAEKQAADARQLPLLSIYPAQNGEWVAWNSETGYYNASANGERLIGWHVNPKRAGAVAQYRLAEEMRDEKNQPDVLIALMKPLFLDAATLQSRLAVRNSARSRTHNVYEAARSLGLDKSDVRTVQQTLDTLPRLELYSVAEGEATLPDNAEGIYKAKSGTVTVRLEVGRQDDGPVDFNKLVIRRLASRAASDSDTTSASDSDGGVGGDTLKISPGGTVELTGLAKGLNRVVLVARDERGGTSRPLSLKIAVEGEQRAKPNVYIFAFGVNRFPDESRLSKLGYPQKDAGALIDLFREQADVVVRNGVGVPNRPGLANRLYGTLTIASLTGPEATGTAIRAELAKLRALKGYQENENDLVLVFAATHGVPDPRKVGGVAAAGALATTAGALATTAGALATTTGGGAGERSAIQTTAAMRPRNGAAYLLATTDYNPKAGEYGVALAELGASLQRVRASNVLLLLDTCHSGGIRTFFREAEAKRARTAAFDTLSQSRFITLAACSESQKSYEDTSWEHGAFTYALLRVLRGEFPGAVRPETGSGAALASANASAGVVRVDFARPYISDEVRRIVQERWRDNQQPVAYSPTGSLDEPIVLTRVPRRASVGTMAAGAGLP